MKKDDSYYGAKIHPHHRSATVWVFNKRTRRLVGTLKRTCAPKLSRTERAAALSEFLSHLNIKVPQFD